MDFYSQNLLRSYILFYRFPSDVSKHCLRPKGRRKNYASSLKSFGEVTENRAKKHKKLGRERSTKRLTNVSERGYTRFTSLFFKYAMTVETKELSLGANRKFLS